MVIGSYYQCGFYIGRITGYNFPEGSVSYTYDVNGNVLTVTDSHGTITRTYDALNRVASYTDTYGKVIRYEYDAVGNLSKIIYPDNTAVTYAYDANHNLVRVTDWANRVTAYTYDENNRVIGVTKPDGSVTTTVYDNKQRVTSTVERTSGGVVITGFEYTYDDLSRIVEEKVLADSTKMCYTYDSLNRVTKRTIKNLSNVVLSEESFTYDAAGNITDAPNSCFVYDTNNRLTTFNGNTVSYDLDGNMLSNGTLTCTYDSANKLITAGGHTYTYNAEDIRIRNLCANEDTTYTYDTNCELSKLLIKTTANVTTKYIYGNGLIGEETNGSFKIYHFDFRGSTIAITNASGTITDTFAYDTYGKLISRTGTSNVIFGYNGRDGVVTDSNGLIYMRARYYSPDMRRFINADIIPGEISNAITLNRYAYANGNPVSFVDPFGLWSLKSAFKSATNWVKKNADKIIKVATTVAVVATLTAVTVATAGTATAVIAGGALVGSAVGGTVGAVSGYVKGGIDGAIDGMFIGTISGAASGAIAASPLNASSVAAWNVVIDVGEYMAEQALNGEEITAGGTLIAAGTSLIFGNMEIKLKKGFHIDYDLAPGWLNKAGDLYNDQKLLEHIIRKEAKRANREYAEKKVLQTTARFNDILYDRLWEYGIDTSQEKIRDLIKDVVFNSIENEISENQRK